MLTYIAHLFAPKFGCRLLTVTFCKPRAHLTTPKNLHKVVNCSMATWQRKKFLCRPALLTILFCLTVVAAQSSQDIRLELGFNNTLVADHWNPLKLTRRDQPAQTLTLTIDQGTLRGGEVLAVYRKDLGAANGLDVFEDDVYLPAWRRFSWRVENSERVFASGTVERREVNAQPLTLLISAQPEQWLKSFADDARLLELPFSLLPERLASYDGVETLLIDGTAPAPTLKAVTSAAVAGVTILLLDDLSENYTELELLAPKARQRLGAGWIAKTSADGVRATLSMLTPLETKTLVDALVTDDLQQRPPLVSQVIVLGAASAYALLTLLLIRFLGSAGLLTSFLLTALASVGAWTWLRPAKPQLTQTKTLVLNAELAYVSGVQSIFTLPDADVTLEFTARPTDLRAYTQQSNVLQLNLPRYSDVILEQRPTLSRVTLRLEGETLQNLTDAAMTNVYVKGLGLQADIAAQQALTLGQGEEVAVNQVYERLLPLLPEGTALAQQETGIHIALPTLLLLESP